MTKNIKINLAILIDVLLAVDNDINIRIILSYLYHIIYQYNFKWGLLMDLIFFNFIPPAPPPSPIYLLNFKICSPIPGSRDLKIYNPEIPGLKFGTGIGIPKICIANVPNN